jgi:putative tricarboxylic transport membrane protein
VNESAQRRAGIAWDAVLGAIGLYAVVSGFGYQVLQENGEIGPGFLPAVAGGLVALFAAIDLVNKFRRTPQHDVFDDDAALIGDTAAITLRDETELVDVDIFGRTQKQRNRMLLAVLGIIIATVALVPLLGFLISFGLMLIACAVAVERRRWLPSLIVTVVALTATYLIFVVLLRVPLPQGLLGLI